MSDTLLFVLDCGSREHDGGLARRLIGHYGLAQMNSDISVSTSEIVERGILQTYAAYVLVRHADAQQIARMLSTPRYRSGRVRWGELKLAASLTGREAEFDDGATDTRAGKDRAWRLVIPELGYAVRPGYGESPAPARRDEGWCYQM